MTKNKEDEEGTFAAEPIADDEEGNSRRGLLKRIGLTAAALAALGIASSKGSAQGENVPTDKVPSEGEILAELRKQGITNLEQLAHSVATGNSGSMWSFWVKGKYIYHDAKVKHPGPPRRPKR
jgi:hypothetical protein